MCAIIINMDTFHVAAWTMVMYLCTVAILKHNGRLWAKPPKYLLEKSANAPSTSQALLDPYSLSHVLHGILFYWMFHRWLTPSQNFLASFGLECAWEALENSSFIIDRYRTTTASLDYYGDSVLNVSGDLLSMVAGWFLARTAPVWVSIAVLVAIEIGMVVQYRDNLLLNIIMLVYPVNSIKQWQLQ
jgi:hypothetical protein